MVKTVYFIRHAQSIMSGSVPHEEWPLSELGKSQALRASPILKNLGIEKIYSSPYVRCRETVRPFVEEYGVPLEFHEDLREQRLNYGWMDDFHHHWARVWRDFHYALPECETAHQAQTRFANAVLNISQKSPAQILGISTHGAVIGLFLNRLKSDFAMKETKKLRNLEILKFDFHQESFLWHEKFYLSDLEKIATAHHESPILK